MAKSPKTPSIEDVRSVKPKALSVFKKLGQVNGVGITRHKGAYAVRVNLVQDLDPGVKCPATIDGISVVLKVVGTIRKQSS